MLRIIDNKRIDLTEKEWELYQEICKFYDQERLGINGADLFKGLFETDKNGTIIFLRPPISKFSSMEVYMFLVTVMIHQHIGTACSQAYKLIEIGSAKIKELDDMLIRGNKLIEELSKRS